MTETIKLNGRTLKEEFDGFNRKIDNKDEGTKKIRSELYGIVRIEEMPFFIQEEFTRSKLGISPHVWDDYDVEIKGKTIAVELVKSQLETLERFETILERNRKKK
jgi:hypothetical protein